MYHAKKSFHAKVHAINDNRKSPSKLHKLVEQSNLRVPLLKQLAKSTVPKRPPEITAS
jgi:hypothetical protein